MIILPPALYSQVLMPSSGNKTNRPAPARFSETDAWHDVGPGWQPLFGSFRGVGYSIEWHDFQAKREFDRASSFHPECVELCLNLDDSGFVEGRGNRAEFAPNTAGFYFRQKEPLTAKRTAGEQHKFLTVEFSCPSLAKHLTDAKGMLHPAGDGGDDPARGCYRSCGVIARARK